MQLHSGRHRASWPRRGEPGARRVRLAALIGVAAAALALPLAGASAGPLGDAGRLVARMSGLTDEKARTAVGAVRGGEERHDKAYDDEARQNTTRDERAHGAAGHAGGARSAAGHAGGARAGAEEPTPSRSPLLLGIGTATATRCGPELSSPDGIEAQTCVLMQGEDTWARSYYRNATGEELSSVLSLMAPDGRSVRMHCAVGAQDEPGVCETPRERTQGDLGAYTAVAEFAASARRGPLLLRSGSN